MPLVLIPVVDEAAHPAGLDLGRREIAVLEDAALKDREPDLDLVHPGRMLRRVHEVEAATVAPVEARPALVGAIIMDIEVVPDHVDGLARVATGQFVHEGHQCVGASVRNDAPENAPTAHVEGGQQRLHPVTHVLVLEAHRRIAGIHPRGVLALKHLQRLLVDADDDRTRGRRQVQLTYPIRLRAEVWILALEPLPHPMWAEILEAEDAPDFARADDLSGALGQRLGQRPIGPQVPKRHLTALGPSAGQLHQLTPSCDRDS